MKLQQNASVLQDFNKAIQYEWLETNGLGGWSGSTVIGCNSRRYHALLVSAIVPPTDRVVMLSKLEETIVSKEERFELATNDYGNAIHPKGFQYLQHFEKEIFPVFIYETPGIILKKTIAMIYGENTIVIYYEVLQAENLFTLELMPLLAVRNYHSLMHANESLNPQGKFSEDIFSIQAYADKPNLLLSLPGAVYQSNPNWFYNFNYRVEEYRGLDFTEDLFSPGKFSIKLNETDSFGIIVSTDSIKGKIANELLSTEHTRRTSLLKNQPADESFRQLLLAADQFIVKRGTDLKTIIAGYHWFTDWGRDTMISLPGLCLVTGRYEDARKILLAFAGAVNQGMLPTRFQDGGQAPEYNNADGTLWYFIAVYKYLRATREIDIVLSEFLPVLKDIIDWHFKGTRYNIHVTEEGLLYAGEPGQQLTWMDARVENWVVTPRMGKPIEIQALWYNALKIYAELLLLNNQHDDADSINLCAEKARKSFAEQFWYEQGEYFYDNMDENGQADTSLRPNQLFAMSLPFGLMETDKANIVLGKIENELYCPVGLRTLPKTDPRYVSFYGGNIYHRDGSYHQGTVWSWLLGPYVDAIMKVGDNSQEAKLKAAGVIEKFNYHLNEGCIGSVSEIFDAEAPHHPRGCVAQAWGVAEILRVMKEYELFGA